MPDTTPRPATRPFIRRAGDAVLLVEYEPRIDPAINTRVLALARAVRALDLGGVRDVIESYTSVAVQFDPLRTDVERLARRLEGVAAQSASADTPTRTVTLPVCYGGVFGPDLADVAAYAGRTEAAVVDLHQTTSYRVYMLGFVPGFAYLGVLDSVIAMPRRRTPRVRVPPGSVGIAGAQTGVYPVAAPGGWQLIGRCPTPLFDVTSPQPSLLRPGDRVQFEAIDETRFDQLTAPAPS